MLAHNNIYNTFAKACVHFTSCSKLLQKKDALGGVINIPRNKVYRKRTGLQVLALLFKA